MTKITTLDEYQSLAMRTRNPIESVRERELNFSLGLGGEAGEVLNIIKKINFHGKNTEENYWKVFDELGDVMWYIAALCDTMGWSMAEVAEHNIEKLRERYPEKFDSERAPD